MTDKLPEFHGEGGSYEVRDGKRVRVVEATKDHPEGNRARDADGRPLGAAEEAKPNASVTAFKRGPRNAE